jgi:hypothetical protein
MNREGICGGVTVTESRDNDTHPVAPLRTWTLREKNMMQLIGFLTTRGKSL